MATGVQCTMGIYIDIHTHHFAKFSKILKSIYIYPSRLTTGFPYKRSIYLTEFSKILKSIHNYTHLYIYPSYTVLAEANLEPKNTFQLLLSAEILPLESGADDKVPRQKGTKELIALSAPQPR